MSSFIFICCCWIIIPFFVPTWTILFIGLYVSFDNSVFDIVNLSKDDIKSSGYIVDTLEASLWCLLNNDNYKDGVLSAVNLGGDTDTIGAITGGLCGIIYGKKQIPREWLVKLRKRKYVEEYEINGYISMPEVNKSNRNHMVTIVNGRVVISIP